MTKGVCDSLRMRAELTSSENVSNRYSKESAFLEGGFDLPLEGAIPKTTSSATTIEPHVPDLVYLDGAHIV
jgi:hypothetical protein